MRIMICPVSGGGFPIQLGLISELIALGITPQIFFGASGGNVAGYLSLAADWSPHGIHRLCQQLHSGLFCQSWWPKIFSWMPSWSIGYFRGSLYRSGFGTYELFSSMFTPQNIQGVEMWTVTRNRSTGKGQLFCNREKSILPVEYFEPEQLNCMPLTYLGGEIDKIATISLASASIPLVVPEQYFEGQAYVDGGTIFASPLTPLQHVIRQYPDLHLDYLNSYDAISSTGTPRLLNLFQNGETTAHEIVNSLILHDRYNALEVIRNGPGSLEFEEGPCNRQILKEIEIKRSKYQRSILELYPDVDVCIDMLDFDGDHVNSLIKQTRNKYKYRLWYKNLRHTETEFSECWYRN